MKVGDIRKVTYGHFRGELVRVKEVYQSPDNGTQVVLQCKNERGEWVDFCRESADNVRSLTA
jgi:hypothetical protein